MGRRESTSKETKRRLVAMGAGRARVETRGLEYFGLIKTPAVRGFQTGLPYRLMRGCGENASRRGARVRERGARQGENMDTHDRSALENTADDPDPPRDDDRELATEEIGKLGNGEGTDEGAGRHGGDDGALRI